jgi:hypothetical protein
VLGYVLCIAGCERASNITSLRQLFNAPLTSLDGLVVESEGRSRRDKVVDYAIRIIVGGNVFDSVPPPLRSSAWVGTPGSPRRRASFRRGLRVLSRRRPSLELEFFDPRLECDSRPVLVARSHCLLASTWSSVRCLQRSIAKGFILGGFSMPSNTWL